MEELLFYLLAAIAELFFVPLLSFPVVLTRWLIFRKKTFKEYWQYHKEKDAYVVSSSIMLCLLVLWLSRVYIYS